MQFYYIFSQRMYHQATRQIKFTSGGMKFQSYALSENKIWVSYLETQYAIKMFSLLGKLSVFSSENLKEPL